MGVFALIYNLYIVELKFKSFLGVFALIYNLYIVELKAINNNPKDTHIEEESNVGSDDKDNETEESNSIRGKFKY